MTYFVSIVITLAVALVTLPSGGYACHKQGGATHKDCGGGGGGGGEGPVPWDPVFAYVKEIKNGSAVFVANADGSDEREVIRETNEIEYEDPVWSPEGERLVLRSDRGDRGIYVMQMQMVLNQDTGEYEWFGDWSEPILIANRIGLGLGRPVWHPDGQLIAYDDNAGPDTNAIFITMADGSTAQNPAVLLEEDGSYYAAPAWSEDGNSLAVIKGIPGNDDIEVFAFSYDASDPMISTLNLESRRSLLLEEPDNPISGHCPPPEGDCIGVLRLGWSRTPGSTLLVANIILYQTDSAEFTVWCIDANDPGESVDLMFPDSRNAVWSPDDTEILVGKATFVRKGNGNVGNYDTSLEILELEQNEDSPTSCPTPTGAYSTLFNPPLGEYIGNPSWR